MGCGFSHLQNGVTLTHRQDSLSLFQGIFPPQGSNLGLSHCRQILYQLSRKGSPRILEWVAYSISSRPSLPRNRTRVSCFIGRFFTKSYQGSPTGKIHELNEPMHVKWFADRLALASGIQYFICHFYNFVKLVGKQVIGRTARVMAGDDVLQILHTLSMKIHPSANLLFGTKR